MPICPNCGGARTVGAPLVPCPTCNGTGALPENGGSSYQHEATLYLDGGQKLRLDRVRNGATHHLLPGSRKV